MRSLPSEYASIVVCISVCVFWRPGRWPSGHEAGAFVLIAPSGVQRALHAELDEPAGCFRAQVVLTEARARPPVHGVCLVEVSATVSAVA